MPNRPPQGSTKFIESGHQSIVNLNVFKDIHSGHKHKILNSLTSQGSSFSNVAKFSSCVKQDTLHVTFKVAKKGKPAKMVNFIRELLLPET